MNLILRYSFVFILFSSLSSLFSQTSSIQGKVIDSTKNEALQGARITLQPGNVTVLSNANGIFQFQNLKADAYTISFKNAGYLGKVIDSIIVDEGKTIELGSILLSIKIETFKKGTVRFKKAQATVAAGVQDQKKSEQVISVVTGETIKNSQASDAAKVAASVPGVTLMENRFIMLRGLSQRYNSVQINNINAPSTEVDRRAFSFDLIPANMLDKMSIYKSPSSDIAGDFAGGVIKLQTKSEIEKDFVLYNLGFGYRIHTTLSSHFNNSVGSSTDMFGFDNGNRALPKGFPVSLSEFSSAQNVSYGKQIRNNYSVKPFTSPLDFGFGFGFGKNFELGKMSVFTINNFGYSNSYQYAAMSRYRYQKDQINNKDTVRQMFQYKDDNFTIETKLNVLSNWQLKVSDNTNFTFKNLFNQIGENETTIRSGMNPTERPNDEWKNYSFHYTSRSLYFTQFEGTHRLGKTKKLVYTAGYSNISRNEPDFRRFRTVRAMNSNEEYTMVDPPSANLFDAARFYSKLKENTVSFTINYESKIRNFLDSNPDITIRLGTYVENKSRDFNARWFGYKYSGDPNLKLDFLQTPIDQIFAPENINSNGGFKPEEGTNPSDKYKAQNQLLTTYFNSSLPLESFNIQAGVRAEYFNQTLQSATSNGKVNVELNNLNILPSFNASYFFDAKKKNLLRLAYGRTVNRPEFRELAPFVYYDFKYDVNIIGNPDLKSCVIDNMDMRFETYPSSSETMNFGIFYKRFLNPIENYVQPVGLSQQFQLKNAKSATNMGIEMEIRRSLENAVQNPFLKKLSMLVNASYIISKVDLGSDSTLSQASSRPLQGQSPYIVNASFQYKNDSNYTVTISYNIFGKRIVYVGNTIFPTVFEMPRHSVDITVTRSITKRLSIKFGVSDLLNYKNQLWQDSNGDSKINYNKKDTDHQLLEYRRGQVFNFSISYKIVK